MGLRLWRRLSHIWHQRQLDADLTEEMEFHRQMKQQEFENSGVSASEAAGASRRALGNATLAREDARAVWIWRWLDDLWRDVTYAMRGLRRDPGFAAVVALTLALGIAASTAMFTVCDALLVRALPYPDSDRLVALRSMYSSPRPDTGLASPLDLADWQARTTSFDAIAGYRWRTVDLTGGAYSERLYGLWATPEFFRVFGVTRVHGLTFTPRDRGHESYRP